jgi:hypothetical protein
MFRRISDDNTISLLNLIIFPASSPSTASNKIKNKAKPLFSEQNVY